MNEIVKKHVNIEILDENELVFLNGGTSEAGVDEVLKGIKDFIESLNLICNNNAHCPSEPKNYNCPCRPKK